MSTLKSSAEDLTLNADGSGNDIILQSNGSTKAIVTAEGTAGIGTATPNKTLDVTSTAGSAGTPNGLYLYNTIHGSDSQIYMYAENDSGTLKGGYIKFDPDAETLSLASNVNAISIDSTGAVTKPLQPAFQVTLSTSMDNIAASTDTTIEFDTETFDTNADFNTGTYTFTAPVTGKYLLTLSTRLQQIANNSSYIYIGIITSNRDYKHIFDPTAFNAQEDYWTPTISIVADMDASDTAYSRIFASSAGAVLDISSSAPYTNFTGCLLA